MNKWKALFALALFTCLALFEPAIVSAQQANGTWTNQSWAPIMGQSIATKGLNRARQLGVKVPDMVLSRAETYARKNFDGKSGRRSQEETSHDSATMLA